MLKIADQSEHCYKSELDLFTIPPTQTAVEEGIWDTIQPNSGYETNPNCEFRVIGDSLHYVDLSATELYAEVQILGLQKDAKTMKLSNGNPILPVNNLLHSMFENITVRFNSTIVEQVDQYPYKAYLEDLLNHDHLNMKQMRRQKLS